MPIIELVSSADPICQGDLLSDIPLFVTSKLAESRRTPHKLCLVLSRPCNAIRNSKLVVAAVEKYPDSVPRDADSFDKVLDFLESIRDGRKTPDLFYLGQIPDYAGRFAARFDSIRTVDVPSDETDRSQFFERHRIGRLEIEFARDLHLRILRAFASLGFDDQNWLSDLDLTWLARQARADVAELGAELNQAQAELAKKLAAGEEAPKKRVEELTRKFESLRERTREFIEQSDYRNEGMKFDVES
jgi:hypothetical protein